MRKTYELHKQRGITAYSWGVPRRGKGGTDKDEWPLPHRPRSRLQGDGSVRRWYGYHPRELGPLTGTKDNRENFQRLLAECRKGTIQTVITKSISRFARNTVTLLSTVRELKTLGVDVYFEEQSLNVWTLSGATPASASPLSASPFIMTDGLCLPSQTAARKRWWCNE